MTVERTDTEPSLLARSTLPRVDYVDTFRSPMPDGVELEAIRAAFKASPPRWARFLMRARDRVVSVFGLKQATKGELFRELGRADDEIVVGEDDRHLDFRVSLRSLDGWLVVATLVRFRNRFGRIYFALIKPFHKRIVPAMLRSALAVVTAGR